MDGSDGLRSTPFLRNERWDAGGTPSLSSTAGRRRYSNAMVTGPKRPDGNDSRSKGRSILS